MKNILVIDDRDDLRAVIAYTLIASGFSVREAKDGREGIRLVISHRPDLIICDVKMPGMDGYRTLEAIRKCPGTAAIPFILTTGSMDRNDFRRGMVSGADDCLMKPFTGGELIAAVKTRLARQTDLQTETFRRAEVRLLEEIRHMSAEFSAPLPGAKPLVGAKLGGHAAFQQSAVNTRETVRRVFSLD